MNIPLYQIDAFTNQLFRGNPAAVCPIVDWPEDHILLAVAKENNLAETAFFRPLSNGHYHLRWFTPEIEIDLCGHATLASAYVIFEELDYQGKTITFESKSGVLTVSKQEEYYELDFPARPPLQSELPQAIIDGLNIQPSEVWKARDYLLLYNSEEDIRTGSAHCTLVPFWAIRMGKLQFSARQLSQRGGELYCELDQDRVKIKGRAVKYMEGTINLS